MSSAISQGISQNKATNVQNIDGSAIQNSSTGDWTLKNASGVTRLTLLADGTLSMTNAIVIAASANTSQPSSIYQSGNRLRLNGGSGGYAFQSSNGTSSLLLIESDSTCTIGISGFTGSHALYAKNVALNNVASTDKGSVWGSDAITLADDAVYTSALFRFRGLMMISDTTTATQILLLMHNTTITTISDVTGTFANADTDGKLCIFYDGAWKIRNRLGATRTFNVTVISNYNNTGL